MTDLGRLGGIQSAAYAINDNGQIVANRSNAQGQEHAFLLTPSL
jgi:probable HAF family extracellular repeat protein